jgi:hypothetical protein
MNEMLTGAVALASILVGLFFLRFWRNTRDRFFLYFSLSFWLQGLNRIAIGFQATENEDSAAVYLVRLAAYALILMAIWEKNRRRRDAGQDQS